MFNAACRSIPDVVLEVEVTTVVVTVVVAVTVLTALAAGLPTRYTAPPPTASPTTSMTARAAAVFTRSRQAPHLMSLLDGGTPERASLVADAVLHCSMA